MPLNDLVKDYSLNTISNKTNIPIEVLEKLLNKEWETLQAPKTKGFITIIEREFNIDLNDLRQEANEFYTSHKKEELQRPIDLVDSQSVSNRGGKVITTIATFVVTGLTLYAIWYYTNSSKDSKISESNSSTGLVKETIDGAKKLIGEDTNNSKKDSAIQTEDKTQEQSPKDNNEAINKNSSVTINTTQESSKKFDITSYVKNSNETQKSDDNDSLVISSNPQDSIELDKKDEEEDEENKSSEKLQEEVQPILETNISSINDGNNSYINNSEVADSNDSTTQTSETNTSEDGISSKTIENNNRTKTKAPKSITVKPNTKRVWLGLYNLKTKRKVSVFIKKTYNYKTDSGDIAIITGNSKFDISTNNGVKKRYTKGGKRYLLVSKNRIKEISEAEYKRVTKRKAW